MYTLQKGCISARPLNSYLYADIIQIGERVAAALNTVEPRLYQIVEDHSGLIRPLLFHHPDIVLIDLNFFKMLSSAEQTALIAHELQHSKQSDWKIRATKGSVLGAAGLAIALNYYSLPLADSVAHALWRFAQQGISYVKKLEEDADDAAVKVTDIHTLQNAIAKWCAYVLENKFPGTIIDASLPTYELAERLDKGIDYTHNILAQITGVSTAERIKRLDAIAKEHNKHESASR